MLQTQGPGSNPQVGFFPSSFYLALIIYKLAQFVLEIEIQITKYILKLLVR